MSFSRQTSVKYGVLLFGALAALLATAGCGGGGGSSSSGSTTGTLTYTTYWGSSAASTASEFVRVVDSTGAVVDTALLNRGAQSYSSASLTGIASGSYTVRVDLYPQANARGTIVSTAMASVALGSTSGDASLTTGTDETPTTITVTPSTPTLTQLQSQQFVATAYGNTGRIAFVTTGSYSWSVTGGIGTVDSTGLFYASTAGSGTVRATHNNTGKIGAAVVTVNAFSVTHGKWTILVYLNAANDLYPYGDFNVNQMERAAGNSDVRFIVQWKQDRSLYPKSSFDGVRRYLIKPDTTDNIVSQVVQSNLVGTLGQPLDMGSATTLHDFIVWGKQYFPADHYGLVVWDHGNGWQRDAKRNKPTKGFSYDEQSGNNIQTWQLDQAFSGQHLDFIAWDACLMQMLEVAYECHPTGGSYYADYIVGSQDNTPAEGYPYDTVFAAFRDHPDYATATLLHAFVDGTLAFSDYANTSITQSVIDTSKIPALATAVDALGTALQANATAVTTAVQSARANAQEYSGTYNRNYFDLDDVCLKLETANSLPAAVVTASTNVRAKVADAVVYEGHLQDSGSHGISIDFSTGSQFSSLRSDYLLLKFGQNTSWATWLGLAP